MNMNSGIKEQQGIYIEIEPWIWLYRSPEDFKLTTEQIKEKIIDSIDGFAPLIKLFEV